MSLAPSAQRAVEWLEQQLADLAGIRNATPRDPSFKNWRQASLGTLQRIWPGDQDRSERFRRIPFSPVDPRADARTVREWYSRGCQEATRVLNGFVEDVRQNGVPDQVVEPVVSDADASFEDDFPTVDLPVGDLSAVTNEPAAEPSMLSEFVDDVRPPDPAGTPAPPSLPSAVPAIGDPSAGVHAHENPSARKGVGARLKDLLGFAQLSAKALAGFPRDTAPQSPLPSLDTPVGTSLPSIDVVPIGGEVVNSSRDAEEPDSLPVPFAEDVVAPAPSASDHVPSAPPTLAVSLPGAAGSSPLAPASGVWPQRADTAVPPPAAAPPPTPIASAPAAGAPPEPMMHEPGMSVVMSRPTTLRSAIEKVSIESLLSDQFRETSEESPVTSELPVDPLVPRDGPEALEQMVDAMLSAEVAPDAAIPAAAAKATPAEPDAIEDDVNRAAEDAAPEPPVIPLFEQVHTAPAPGSAKAARAPADPTPAVPAAPLASPRPEPAPQASATSAAAQAAPASEVDPSTSDLPSGDEGYEAPEFEVFEDESPAEGPPAPPVRPAGRGSRFVQLPPRRRAAPAAESAPEDDSAVGKVDPDAFARAAEEFMHSSPVLGASGRKVKRPNEETGFEDPDAIAVASMVHELGRLDVPSGRQPEVRARLLDLARRVEKGELDWTSLRKAVWFAMEYPEIARRLMPVLLPWIDRAA